MCYSPADGKLLQPGGWKCVFIAMWQRHIHRCYPKELWAGHICKCIIARCAEMCLHGYVAKTCSLVPKSTTGGHIYKCVIARRAEMCLHGYVAKTRHISYQFFKPWCSREPSSYEMDVPVTFTALEAGGTIKIIYHRFYCAVDITHFRQLHCYTPPYSPRAMRPGRAFQPPYHPRWVQVGWTGELYHLGRNKEVFDAELYAVLQAMGVLLRRQELGKNYTTFSDSTAAIERVRTDRPGPGQALAKAIVHFEEVIRERGCTLTIQWTPEHKGLEGNEIAGTYTKWAVDGYTDPIDKNSSEKPALPTYRERPRGQVAEYQRVDSAAR